MKAKQKIYFSIILTLIFFFVFKMILPKNNCSKIVEEKFWCNKTFTKEKYNIIACGDSRVYRGIPTKYLVELMPKNISAYNLGYSSAGFSTEYIDFALSKLKKDSKNKFLILGITPHSLTPNGFLNEQLYQYLNKSKFEVFKKTKLTPFFCYFENYIPLDLLLGQDYSNEYIYHKDGWVEYNPTKIDSTEAIQSYLKIFESNRVNSNDIKLFIEKLKEVHSLGVKIIAFRPPTTFQMVKLEDDNSGLDYEQFVGKTKGFIHWVELDLNNYTSYDGSHLTTKSAIKLSKKIGEEINNSMNF